MEQFWKTGIEKYGIGCWKLFRYLSERMERERERICVILVIRDEQTYKPPFGIRGHEIV